MRSKPSVKHLMGLNVAQEKTNCHELPFNKVNKPVLENGEVKDYLNDGPTQASIMMVQSEQRMRQTVKKSN